MPAWAYEEPTALTMLNYSHKVDGARSDLSKACVTEQLLSSDIFVIEPSFLHGYSRPSKPLATRPYKPEAMLLGTNRHRCLGCNIENMI